jgi:hypothetical protein
MIMAQSAPNVRIIMIIADNFPENPPNPIKPLKWCKDG